MRPVIWMFVGLAAAPAVAYLVFRLAKGLGFLDPPADRQHELRRTIMLAVYAFLVFLPVLIYGFGKNWPGAWILFGILDTAALVFFAGSGIWAARELWRIRHPETRLPETAAGYGERAEVSGEHPVSEALAAAPLATPPVTPAGSSPSSSSSSSSSKADEEPVPPSEL